MRVGRKEALKDRLRPFWLWTAKRILPIAYRGSAVECPCCSGAFRRFARFGGRDNALCPRCFALERHRLLCLYLSDHPLGQDLSVLHFAPEESLQTKLRRRERYVGADLDSPRADVKIDITAIPYEEEFDVVICNHVLEHIPNDRKAMRELARALKPGGIALMQHPMDESRAETYEDPTLTSPEQRLAAFGQFDHVRVYGRDFVDRLHEAGFDVEVIDYFEELSSSDQVRYGLRHEPIFRCSRRSGPT